jgi:branched-chain amino acid transport system permease protein
VNGWPELLQLLVSGVAQGLIYALIAFGYNLTYSTSKTINFSIGNILMVGGVTGLLIYMNTQTGQPSGQSFFLALAATSIVCSSLGLLVYKLAVEPSLRRGSDFAWVLATLAFGIIIKTPLSSFGARTTFVFYLPWEINLCESQKPEYTPKKFSSF